MKEKLVTRTIVTTKIRVVGISTIGLEDATQDIREYEVEGKIKKENAIKIINEKFNTSGFHPALVLEVKEEEKVLGLPLSHFIEYGVPVERPKSQRKDK